MRLVKFNKTECGVDFLMKVGSPKDLVEDMSDTIPFRKSKEFRWRHLFYPVKQPGEMGRGV